MAAERAPAFQFYPRDFIGDLDVAAASLEEVGAYTLLLCYAWLKEGLPDEPDKLARALHISRAKFDRLWEALAEKFPASTDGRLRNPRQEEERGKQKEWKELSVAGGQASASARQQKYGSSNPRSNREPIVNRPVHEPHEPNVNSSSSSASSVPPLAPQEGAEGRFWETWRQLLKAKAGQTVLLSPNAKEADWCMRLVARYPDEAWLALIAEAYVVSEDKRVRDTGRSLGSLHHWAGEIEGALRKSGRRPASEAAA